MQERGREKGGPRVAEEAGEATRRAGTNVMQCEGGARGQKRKPLAG